MSLYQRIRPTTLDEVKGNRKVVGLLEKLARRAPEDRPHVFIFSGPRGCGKTTLARILCTTFDCKDANIFENNAANNRGIDTYRDVASKAPMKPMGGGAKAYIFDEAHQITGAAQECLLKVLEEVPEHCYFFFCTTEPEKLISTIHSRSTKYVVKPCDEDDIIALLLETCDAQGWTVPDSVIEGIISACGGHPRDALVLLEQVMDADKEDAMEILNRGTMADPEIIELCKLMYRNREYRAKHWMRIVEMVDAMTEEPDKIRRSINGFLWYQMTLCNETEVAEDLTDLMKLFSTSVYYGGKAQLGSLITRACFSKF